MKNDTIDTLKKLSRKRIYSIWEIAKTGNLDVLNGEDKKYAEAMLEHEEEYFSQFEIGDLTYDHEYDPDSEENPFLHVTLHIVVENQLEAREPIEVYQFYNSIRKKKISHHDTVHLIAAILAPIIVSALGKSEAADMALYKSLLRKYKGKKPEKIWRLMDNDLDPLFQD